MQGEEEVLIRQHQSYTLLLDPSINSKKTYCLDCLWMTISINREGEAENVELKNNERFNNTEKWGDKFSEIIASNRPIFYC